MWMNQYIDFCLFQLRRIQMENQWKVQLIPSIIQ